MGEVWFMVHGTWYMVWSPARAVVGSVGRLPVARSLYTSTSLQRVVGSGFWSLVPSPWSLGVSASTGFRVMPRRVTVVVSNGNE